MSAIIFCIAQNNIFLSPGANLSRSLLKLYSEIVGECIPNVVKFHDFLGGDEIFHEIFQIGLIKYLTNFVKFVIFQSEIFHGATLVVFFIHVTLAQL